MAYLKRLFPILLRSWMAFAAVLAAHAQYVQQGGKLIGSGALDPASQGASVAISQDGNTAIVGGSTDNDFAGAAWVFTRAGSTWKQQGNKLTVNEGSEVGASV